MDTELKIKVFAVLKEYLNEEFTISKPVDSILALKSELININPAIEKLINSCRFAVNNTFVDISYVLKKNETIYIIPPSSGG